MGQLAQCIHNFQQLRRRRVPIAAQPIETPAKILVLSIEMAQLNLCEYDHPVNTNSARHTSPLVRLSSSTPLRDNRVNAHARRSVLNRERLQHRSGIAVRTDQAAASELNDIASRVAITNCPKSVGTEPGIELAQILFWTPPASRVSLNEIDDQARLLRLVRPRCLLHFQRSFPWVVMPTSTLASRTAKTGSTFWR
jgi:hypothetical protein